MFALIGVFVNIGVAWSLSLWPTGVREFSDFGSMGSLSALQDIFGTDLMFASNTLGGSSFRGVGVEGTTFAGLVTGANPGAYVFDEYAAGWPLLALRGSRREVPGNYEFHGCVPLPGILRPSSDRPLLFLPIFPGFVVNAILYAAVSLSAYQTVRALRQHRRKRRGLCSGCGYPMGSSGVCTECGRQLRELPATKS